MTYAIPTASIYTEKRGDKGIAVWALQRSLNKRNIHVTEDGDFGPATEAAVKELQGDLKVTQDGVCGPATQQALAKALCLRQRIVSELPDKLLDSLIWWEAGDLLAAVNWGTPGGVDCGIVQRRVYSGSYNDQAQLMRVFDAAYQLGLLAGDLRALHDMFSARAGVLNDVNPNELAWRLAVLNHNYPYAADLISRVGVHQLPGYFLTPQEWVVDARMKFPDGDVIETPLEWCQRYSLGNKYRNEPGQAVKQVVSWTN